MLKDTLLGKHSQNNRDSKEGQALRLVRESLKLSLKEVAAKMNLKAIEVDHFENGRKFYTEDDIQKFLKCFNFSDENFKSLLKLNLSSKQMVNHFIIGLRNAHEITP